MAIYHFSMKTISRSHGRSATAAIAYRAGVKIVDERTGEVHDYRKKSGISGNGIVLPKNAPEWAKNREQLWNEVEKKETRKNSTVAREIIVALPTELDEKARFKMVHDFAERLVQRHQCAVDFAIHEPSKQGDDRNHHAHILMSTRRLTAGGFTEKTRELDERNSGEIGHWREQWANYVNQCLEKHGYSERVSHLSLAEQGIDREPTKHKGVVATSIERKKAVEIKANPNLTLMEKSRQIRVERPQISGKYEQASGYDFGVKIHQNNDKYINSLNFDIQRQEIFLRELMGEHERLAGIPKESEVERAKKSYREKLDTLDTQQRAKAQWYEKMGLAVMEKLPEEILEKTKISFYLNQADKIHDGKFHAPDPVRAQEPKQEHGQDHDWEMER